MSMNRAHFGLAIAALLAVPSITSAQRVEAPRRTAPPVDQIAVTPANGAPVGRTDASSATIVLVATLPDPDAAAVVIRRRAAQPQNVILVTERTRPDELTQAVRLVFRSREQVGDALRGDLRASVRPGVPGSPANRERAQADLQRLRAAATQQVAGVGQHRAITVRLNAPKDR